MLRIRVPRDTTLAEWNLSYHSPVRNWERVVYAGRDFEDIEGSPTQGHALAKPSPWSERVPEAEHRGSPERSSPSEGNGFGVQGWRRQPVVYSPLSAQLIDKR